MDPLGERTGCAPSLSHHHCVLPERVRAHTVALFASQRLVVGRLQPSGSHSALSASWNGLEPHPWCRSNRCDRSDADKTGQVLTVHAPNHTTGGIGEQCLARLAQCQAAENCDLFEERSPLVERRAQRRMREQVAPAGGTDHWPEHRHISHEQRD